VPEGNEESAIAALELRAIALADYREDAFPIRERVPFGITSIKGVFITLSSFRVPLGDARLAQGRIVESCWSWVDTRA
jgi:hypothetical protein